MKVWQATEWQSLTNRWHCNCVDNLAGDSGAWYLPARILGLTPANFIKFLFENFKPDHFSYCKEKCLCFWSWDDQNAMRKYKNFINKKAREKNFQI